MSDLASDVVLPFRLQKEIVFLELMSKGDTVGRCRNDQARRGGDLSDPFELRGIAHGVGVGDRKQIKEGRSNGDVGGFVQEGIELFFFLERDALLAVAACGGACCAGGGVR